MPMNEKTLSRLCKLIFENDLQTIKQNLERQREHPLAGKKWDMQWFNRKIMKMFMDFLPHFGDFWRWVSRSQAFSLTRGIRVKPLNVMHGSLVLVKTFEAQSVARFKGFAVQFFWESPQHLTKYLSWFVVH